MKKKKKEKGRQEKIERKTEELKPVREWIKGKDSAKCSI